MTQTAALLITLVIEVPVVWLLARRVESDRVRIVLIACAASLLTHPFAWWANASFVHLPFYAVRLPLIEISVVVAESLFYRLLLFPTAKGALLASALANALSVALGLVVYYALTAL